MAACIAPRLFRYKETRQYRLTNCGRWCCPACARGLAARWQSLLTWVTDHGEPPQFLITLTCREPLPLWRSAPPDQREAALAQARALAQSLTRALTRLVAKVRTQFGDF